MPVITVYRHGITGGVAPRMNSHVRAKRSEVGGWSKAATRRNTQFLRSVLEDELTGTGFAVTLTLRDCPASAEDWHKLRRAWENRMRRAGAIRMHWVTEWQRRGVPHLHIAIWWPSALTETQEQKYSIQGMMTAAWIAITGVDHRSAIRGQDAHLITGVMGWFQYVSKHAARGIQHYQRSALNMPAGWKNKTGRMWGKMGHWPLQAPVKFYPDDQRGDGGWFVVRRLLRSWRIADARASGNAHRIKQARSMLRCHNKARSRTIGFSEWMGEETTIQFFLYLKHIGYKIPC